MKKLHWTCLYNVHYLSNLHIGKMNLWCAENTRSFQCQRLFKFFLHLQFREIWISTIFSAHKMLLNTLDWCEWHATLWKLICSILSMPVQRYFSSLELQHDNKLLKSAFIMTWQDQWNSNEVINRKIMVHNQFILKYLKYLH